MIIPASEGFLTLAYLGPEGTFSHQAACLFLQAQRSSALIPKACPTISRVISAVNHGEAFCGIVPVENSIEGSVNVTMDLLAGEPSVFVHAEIVVDIRHYLYSRMTDFARIHTVMSHPQAIAQCRRFLELRLGHAAVIETASTAEAVRRLLDCDEGYAAIGSPDNSKLYDIPVLCTDIGDYQHNQTRFFVINKNAKTSGTTKKTSLILALEKDRPGGLYEILGEFAAEKINLTRIESRPAKSVLGSYIFFVDCEAGHDHAGLQKVLERLAAKRSLIKNLGSYDIIPGR